MEVPYVNLAAAYRELKPELDEAVQKVIASGSYILGENVAALEDEFSSWLGVAEAVTVNSGTDALYLSLKALGIGDGHEVITVSHTAVNTALAIAKTGAEPVFVDVDADTFCMDPGALAGALSERTRALMPVHLYGHPVDMDPVMDFAAEHGLPVIEDCAQAHGALYRERAVGSIGHAGCFSFYPTKNLGACGDGGAVVTDDAALARKLRSLANCGQGEERYRNEYRGDVSRLDELQAAILREKLKRLDACNRRRREIASYYLEGLSSTGLVLPIEREWGRHVYHLFVVRSGRRDALKTHLERSGVQAMVHYPLPVHLQPAFAEHRSDRLPQTQKLVDEILSLPVYPELSKDQLDHVIGAIGNFQQEH